MDHEAGGAGRLPPFPIEWDSDAERGAGLLGWWTAAVAEKNGIPIEAISLEFAEAVRASVLTVEANSAGDAALQIALHKAAMGDFEAAGRFIRDHIKSGALSIVKDNQLERQERAIQEMEPDAARGAKTAKGASQGGKSRAAGYADRDCEIWRVANEIKATYHDRMPSGAELALKVADALHPELKDNKSEREKTAGRYRKVLAKPAPDS